MVSNASLLLEVQQLREELAQRDRTIELRDQVIAQLQQSLRELQHRLEQSERAAKRQAAPFSKGEPKKDPAKPGRKKGSQHGKHGHRLPPAPEQVEETLDAPLPEQCPQCGGALVEDHLDTQFQTEIPRQPIRRKIQIHCGHCAACGKRVRGRHPLQTSTATGAAQSQLGADAQAAIVDLNKRAGMSYGKIAGTFDKLFGIPITPGACAQIVLRGSRNLQPVYQQIREHLQSSQYLTPDETGWRIGGHPTWLHAWVGDEGTTCYVIDPRRDAGVLAEVLGWKWSGTMTHDGWSSYDRFVHAGHQQCVDHLLRRARALVDNQIGAAKAFPQQVLELVGPTLQVRNEFLAGQRSQSDLVQTYEQVVSELMELTERPRTNALNETFAKHLYHYAEQWFQFLLDPNIPATNHRAEQALKTPIVNRKVWGGNRTDAGGKAQVVTCSVLQTCKNKAIDSFTFCSNAFRGVLGNLFTPASPQTAK